MDAGFQEGNGWRCNFLSISVYGKGGVDLGGPNFLLLLAKMSLGSCERLGKIFSDDLTVDSGPSGVIAGTDGRGPCWYDWAESNAM